MAEVTQWMRDAMAEALAEARAAIDHGDVPVGAVVVQPGDGCGRRARPQRARAQRRSDRARRAARAASRGRVSVARGGSTTHALVVTLEPCPMCAGALVGRARAAARLRRGRPEGRRGGQPLQLRRRSAPEPHDRDRGRCARRRVRSAAHRVLREPAVTRHVTSRPEGCESGRIGWSRKPLWRKSPWVQIPLPPPQTSRSEAGSC